MQNGHRGATDTIARAAHDVGLAAWFGGSLMGAVGLNGATKELQETPKAVKVSNAGWARWTPANAAAIGAHIIASGILLRDDRTRVRHQRGVMAASLVKTGLLAGALAATAYARALGERLIQAGEFSARDVTHPNERTPEDIAKIQRKMAMMQWVVPALTGGILVVSAQMSEQQRPEQVAKGVAGRLKGNGRRMLAKMR